MCHTSCIFYISYSQSRCIQGTLPTFIMVPSITYTMLQSSVGTLLTQRLPRLPRDCVGVRFCRCWRSNRVHLVRGLAGRCRVPDRFSSSSIDKTTKVKSLSMESVQILNEVLYIYFHTNALGKSYESICSLSTPLLSVNCKTDWVL